MLDRKSIMLFLIIFLILTKIPPVSCANSAPIIYVSWDGSGDFNCDATNAAVKINEALQLVAENSSYTTVYLKGPFTYFINDTLVISNSTTLAGDSSATIKLVSNASWVASKPLIKESNFGSHDIIIRGFTIDGNREGNTNVESGKYYYDLIHLTSCQNISVYDMNLTNNHGDGLKTDSCSNIKLNNNTIYELGHDALYASYCSDVEAYNNTITCRTNSGLRLYNTNNAGFHDNVITSNNAGGAGIEIQKYGSPAMDNIEVYNNTIYKTALAGIWIFGSSSYLPSSANIHIHHNRIYDTGTRSSTSVRGGILSDGFNALIENNVIDGAYGAGIVQNNAYPGLAGSGYVVTVKNNIITNTRTSTASGNGYGIYNLLTNTHSFILQNNCFYNNTGGDFASVRASPSDIVADPQYADWINHDYHLKSKAGRWNGNGWINDIISSPCIDAGNPLSNYSDEPEPNGNRINIGPDGDTYYASKSELKLLTPALPTADFSSNITGGYAPLSIQFIDISRNTTAWNWDFGDGTYSTQQNPLHTYSAAGNYTVTLTASNENGTDIITSIISVSERPVLPVADFSSSVASGYAPLLIQFTDLSQNAAGWNWNFGDGAVSAQQNPTHTYSSAGSYNVTLTASNINGTSSKSTIITVLQKPILPLADFSNSVSRGYAPLSVQFTDRSLYAAGWNWNFGDGAVSTQPNPVHTFSLTGSYNVTLTASNINGTNSKSATIAVLQRPILPVADFSNSAASGYAPLSIQFTDRSQNTTSRSWDFTNDGITDSSILNPVYTYAIPGTYTAKLTVSNTNGTNSKTASVTVLKPISPKANFSSNITSGTVPLNVLFIDTSTNTPTSWTWSFGDGTSSLEQNPVHTYSKTGRYAVRIAVRNAAGNNTLTRSNYIAVNALKPPIASFSATATSGYVPFSVSFTDGSTGLITSRSWSFGDGTSSTEQNPVHTYNKTGRYTVRLTVRNAAGGNTLTKSNYITINVLRPPVAAFSASPASGKAPLRVQFTDKSIGSPTSWRWSFGDGTSSTTRNPVHVYPKKGKFAVSLTARNSQGSNTNTVPGYITVS